MKWTKLESWRPAARVDLTRYPWIVINPNTGEEWRSSISPVRAAWRLRKSALAAANKQNRLEGLPEVQ